MDDYCEICYQGFGSDGVISYCVSCSQDFHQNCTDLLTSDICPVCRNEFRHRTSGTGEDHGLTDTWPTDHPKMMIAVSLLSLFGLPSIFVGLSLVFVIPLFPSTWFTPLLLAAIFCALIIMYAVSMQFENVVRASLLLAGLVAGGPGYDKK